MGSPYGFSQQNISRYYSKKNSSVFLWQFFLEIILSLNFFEIFNFLGRFFSVDFEKMLEFSKNFRIFSKLMEKIWNFSKNSKIFFDRPQKKMISKKNVERKNVYPEKTVTRKHLKFFWVTTRYILLKKNVRRPQTWFSYFGTY